MGALSDHLGRRKLLIQAGLVVMAIGTLGFLFANRFVELIVLRSLQGVGVALTVPASMAIMAEVTFARATPRPPKGHLKATPRRVDSQGIGT